ncbi:helix-turn-helix domain-containing protein [Streptomyces sp. NPDC050509]|uniref:helix-turn-helix domain-containing protein n=1 Tax=Streptomyces sp. NPDC050509 TaxID=3365620 RepID=UPI0037BDA0BE
MMDIMVTRAESAAITRRALLDAAAELLDLGGPEAVTLREVGARAGVSRGAPYRHFTGKDSLRTDPALAASE